MPPSLSTEYCLLNTATAYRPLNAALLALFFHHLHTHDVEARVHVQHFAGDALRKVAGKEDCHIADVVNGHILAHGRFVREVFVHVAEAAHARRRQCADGARRDRIDADLLWTEIICQIAGG